MKHKSPEEVKELCRLVRDRGQKEITPGEVLDWLWDVDGS
jgi:hypothetical protein